MGSTVCSSQTCALASHDVTACSSLHPCVTAAGLQARNMSLPTGTLYVAEAGFLLERAQVWTQSNVVLCFWLCLCFSPSWRLSFKQHSIAGGTLWRLRAFTGAKACAADGT